VGIARNLATALGGIKSLELPCMSPQAHKIKVYPVTNLGVAI